MCSLFTSQDPATYACETRAIRLHGHATSIRLEAGFWDILEEIAAREGLTVSRFVGTLHDEILARLGEVPNFASFLRVTCLHWLRNQDVHAAQLAARRPLAVVA
jgi:predicted DNA-binding ribbon-helix-helix protein